YHQKGTRTHNVGECDSDPLTQLCQSRLAKPCAVADTQAMETLPTPDQRSDQKTAPPAPVPAPLSVVQIRQTGRHWAVLEQDPIPFAVVVMAHLFPPKRLRGDGPLCCRERLGGLLTYYYRNAA